MSSSGKSGSEDTDGHLMTSLRLYKLVGVPRVNSMASLVTLWWDDDHTIADAIPILHWLPDNRLTEGYSNIA